LAEMEQRLSDVVFKSVPQRVACTLLVFQQAQAPHQRWRLGRGACEVCLTHEQLAEFVGSYRETVTKALDELRDRGVIELRRGKIVRRALTALEALAAEYTTPSTTRQ